jgi:glycosyltransferase involved in cell wall biosynthesis
MMLPKVSVIIPCYNHGEFLPEAVSSVTSMRSAEVELIVVDDGSTDDRTRREMNSLEAAGIHVIHQKNKGLAAARNAGISAAQAKYVLPLDADNRVRDAYIDFGIRILDSDPQIGVVYGDAEYMGIRTGRWHVGPFDLTRLVQWNYIDACAVYRRVVWEQNGGYDGTMPTQGLEDWDFWLSTVQHGWKFRYVPEVLFDYRTAHDSMLARSHAFDLQTEKFIAAKHAALHREAFMQLTIEHESVKLTARNFFRLLKSRLSQKTQGNGRRS